MRWRIIFGLVALFVTQALAQSNLGTRSRWNDNMKENLNDNLIDIDVETERNEPLGSDWDYEVSGSGSGMDNTDDEDLMGSGYGSGDGTGVTPPFTRWDQPPRADAGRDVEVEGPHKPVVLCGNNSTGRDLVRYQWSSLTTDKNVDMMGTKDVCLKLKNLEEGRYMFRLTVFDARGNMNSDDVVVNVKKGKVGTTPAPLTPCQHLRDASRRHWGNFIPRCTDTGEYGPLQCHGHESTGKCWCSDLEGREIPGTSIGVGQPPDCEEGTNLPPCIFKLVQQSRTNLLGAFRPKCNVEGKFESRQCTGSMCYCVDPESGVKFPGTEVFLTDDANCDGDKTTTRKEPDGKMDKATQRPVMKTTPAPAVTESDDKINTNIDNTDSKDDDDKDSGEPNQTGDTDREPQRKPNSVYNMINQPGILAAIIGGSVVLLLCAILLVMFIIYRMRKKDEGSYALDEPKKMPNYSYQRAPDREFYA